MAERVIRNVENDYLMCAICLGRYTDPRLLPCGHTFCRQCLSDHIKQTVTDRGAAFFKCPNDRTEIQRPSVILPPKDWATAFPEDTFLASLLNAVMTHNSQDSDLSEVKCEIHKGRAKEFFCLRCAKAICAYCVVKQHKGNTCEVVSLEEAVEKFKPKIDHLKYRLSNQIQATRAILKGDSPQNIELKETKERAMTELTDLETKVTFFYRTALRQLDEMKTTIRDTGTRQLTENQQASVILGKINDTTEKLEEVCMHGNGIEILKIVSQTDGQVRDYDRALQSLGNQPSNMEVHFVVNRDLEKVFENMPALGSVVVQSRASITRVRERHTFSSSMGSLPVVPSPRNPPTSARSYGGSTARESMASSLNWSQDLSTPAFTPRTIHPVTGDVTERRRSLPPTRPKTTFSVQTPEVHASCWQLTGIVVIQNHVIITDAHNGLVLKCEFPPPEMPVFDTLSLECPVCVAGVPDSFSAVVTLPEKSELAFVDTASGLTLAETIATTKPYEGIACLPDEKCAVSCCVVGKQCIDVINMGGDVLKTITTDASGQPLFSWPRFIANTPTGAILISDRDNRTLVCVDQTGSVKWTYNAPASPWGVSSAVGASSAVGVSGDVEGSSDEGRSVYLCLDSNVVQVLSDAGRVLQNKFITARDGVRVPYAICTHDGKVAVTEWGPSLFSPNSPFVNIFAV